MTGGQRIGDSTSFYWYTEQLNSPHTAADLVSFEDKSWHKSDYRWREKVLREVIREGEKRVASKLVPYRIHLRFNANEEAVYQQYRLDGKVLPMTPEEIQLLQTEVTLIQENTKEQHVNGTMLIQGVWNGEVFADCTGRKYQHLKFNQILPDLVISRFSTQENYTAFVGFSSGTNLVVKELLLLEDKSYGCIEQPVLIEAK